MAEPSPIGIAFNKDINFPHNSITTKCHFSGAPGLSQLVRTDWIDVLQSNTITLDSGHEGLVGYFHL